MIVKPTSNALQENDLPTASTVARPSRRRPAPGRSAIIRAAIEVFGTCGYRGSSLAAIAERCGVTAPLITHHFGTKEALLMEVVAEADQRTWWRLVVLDAPNGLERVRSYYHWTELVEDDAEVAQLLRFEAVLMVEALDPSHPAHQHYQWRQQHMRARTAEHVAQGQRDGSIRGDVDPIVVAREFTAFVQGAHLEWLRDPDGTSLKEVFRTYVTRLADDIGRSSREAKA